MNKYKYKIIIKNIFYYYCNYGNKYNFNYLTSKNFLKLIKDLMINIDKVSLDILYKKVVLNEKHLNYYKFKVIISLISKQLFNEEDNDICLNNIMEYYFIPLYNRVIKQSKIIEIKNLINNKIDIFIVKYIIDNYDIISIIYEYYFVNEIKNIIINNKFKSTEEESISNFLLFCNDFKIFNEFISIQDFLKLLYLTINLKEAKLNKLIQICSNDDRHYFEIGTEIKFIKFIFVIIKIIEYAKNYKYKDTNTEYLITLFFNNIRNKGSIFKFINNGTYNKIKNNISSCINEYKLDNYIEKYKLLFIYDTKIFKNIFEYYCNYGEPNNKTNLKSIKFKKLLSDMKIISLIKDKSIIDILFFKLSKNTHFINYESFLLLLNDIYKAIIKYNYNLDLNVYINAFKEFTVVNKSKIKQSKIIKVDDEYNDKLNERYFCKVKSTIYPLFNYYCNNCNEHLNDKELFKFLSDFEIFPNIINKKNILNILNKIKGNIHIDNFILIIYLISINFIKIDIDNNISKFKQIISIIEYSSKLSIINKDISKKITFKNVIKNDFDYLDSLEFEDINIFN